METIIVDKNLYSLRSILGTAYIFLDRFYIFLDKIDEEKISIQIKAKNGGQEEASMVDDFKNELINTSLRLKISEDNKNIREAIVSAALYGVSIEEKRGQGNKDDNRNNCRESINDPQGICKTWEETHKDEPGQMTHTSRDAGILDQKDENAQKAVNRISPQKSNTDYSKMFSKEEGRDEK